MEYLIQEKTLKDIADSIRNVDPTIGELSPKDMDEQIRRLTATVDQVYDSESANPVAGKAVKQAIEPLAAAIQGYDTKIDDATQTANAAEVTANEALDKITQISSDVVTKEELTWTELRVDNI